MKVAIIGTWHVHTEEYTRAILENPKAEAVAVWDSDAARGKAFADKMGLPFTADLDSILNDADIDSIVLRDLRPPGASAEGGRREEEHLHGEGAHHRRRGR